MDWQPIETAPKDFTAILIAAQGVENTGWMRGIVRWGCRTHCFSSKHHPKNCSSDNGCEMDWLGDMGVGYGVPITHWMPLPNPPSP